MRWIMLILASLCEICWFYCISYLNRFTFRELISFSFIEAPDAWWIGGAIAGYALFGVANMILFAKAIRRIPPAVAFSAWTGLALAGIAITDVVFKDIVFSPLQWISVSLILFGVIGLKFTADKA